MTLRFIIYYESLAFNLGLFPDSSYNANQRFSTNLHLPCVFDFSPGVGSSSVYVLLLLVNE